MSCARSSSALTRGNPPADISELTLGLADAVPNRPHVAEDQQPHDRVGGYHQRGGRQLLLARQAAGRNKTIWCCGWLPRENRDGNQGKHQEKGGFFHRQSSMDRYSSSTVARTFCSRTRAASRTAKRPMKASEQRRNGRPIDGCSVITTDVLGCTVRQTLTDQ